MAGLLSKEQLILGFHKLEGDFFQRLVHDLGQDPTNMRWVIALWLWLESVGHHDFVRRAYAMPGPVVLRIVKEALACLRCLAGEGPDEAADGDTRVARLPCTNAFLADPIDNVGYFVDHRDTVLDGVAYMYKTVCLVVCVGNVGATRLPGDDAGGASRAPTSSPDCAAPRMTTTGFPDDRATALMMSSPRRAAPRIISSPVYDAPLVMSPPWVPMQVQNTMPMPPSALNPMASPWVPMQVQSALPEDYRSLFITFSKGYPVSRDDILNFFNSMFGPCVEAVMLEKVQPGHAPLYGRVVMRSEAMIPVVLGGEQTAKFVIRGRHLWARVYVPNARIAFYA